MIMTHLTVPATLSKGLATPLWEPATVWSVEWFFVSSLSVSQSSWSRAWCWRGKRGRRRRRRRYPGSVDCADRHCLQWCWFSSHSPWLTPAPGPPSDIASDFSYRIPVNAGRSETVTFWLERTVSREIIITTPRSARLLRRTRKARPQAGGGGNKTSSYEITIFISNWVGFYKQINNIKISSQNLASAGEDKHQFPWGETEPR